MKKKMQALLIILVILINSVISISGLEDMDLEVIQVVDLGTDLGEGLLNDLRDKTDLDYAFSLSKWAEKYEKIDFIEIDNDILMTERTIKSIKNIANNTDTLNSDAVRLVIMQLASEDEIFEQEEGLEFLTYEDFEDSEALVQTAKALEEEFIDEDVEDKSLQIYQSVSDEPFYVVKLKNIPEKSEADMMKIKFKLKFLGCTQINIYDADENLVQTIETNGLTQVESDELPRGEYTVYYFDSNDVLLYQDSANIEKTNLIFSDKGLMQTVTFEVVDEETGEDVYGGRYRITSLTTGKTKTIHLNKNTNIQLLPGSYIAQVIKNPRHYTSLDSQIEFQIEYEEESVVYWSLTSEKKQVKITYVAEGGLEEWDPKDRPPLISVKIQDKNEILDRIILYYGETVMPQFLPIDSKIKLVVEDLDLNLEAVIDPVYIEDGIHRYDLHIRPVTGSLKLKFKGITQSNAVSMGQYILVYDENDKQKEILLDNKNTWKQTLPIGNYTLYEVEPPSGYEAFKEPMAIELSKKGKEVDIVKKKINEKKTENKSERTSTLAERLDGKDEEETLPKTGEVKNDSVIKRIQQFFKWLGRKS